MKNRVYSGHTITKALGSATVSGEAYDLGSGLIGVAASSVAANEENEFDISGVKRFANDGNAYSVGDSVDWDAAGKTVVGATLGTHALGVVTKDATASDDVEVMIGGKPGPGPSYS